MRILNFVMNLYTDFFFGRFSVKCDYFVYISLHSFATIFQH